MDALIRDDDRLLSIAMIRNRTLLLASAAFLLVACLLSNSTLASSTPSRPFVTSQDVTRPNIWDWGVIGNPELLEPFTVWANVSDNDGGSGIRNVTLRITGPNAAVRQLMDNNATSALYETNADPLPNDGVFRIWIMAFDLENNTRESYDRLVTAEANPLPTVDPSITLPYVVLGSLGLGAVVVFASYQYDKRRAPESREDSGSEF